jgi:hypothetical protein
MVDILNPVCKESDNSLELRLSRPSEGRAEVLDSLPPIGERVGQTGIQIIVDPSLKRRFQPEAVGTLTEIAQELITHVIYDANEIATLEGCIRPDLNVEIKKSHILRGYARTVLLQAQRRGTKSRLAALLRELPVLGYGAALPLAADGWRTGSTTALGGAFLTMFLSILLHLYLGAE